MMEAGYVDGPSFLPVDGSVYLGLKMMFPVQRQLDNT